jgi:uncharacterized protein with PIN domain
MDSILKTLIEIDKEANNTKLTTIHKQRSIDKSICANCQEEVKEIEDEEYRNNYPNYSDEDKTGIIDYCLEDVLLTEKLFLKQSAALES